MALWTVKMSSGQSRLPRFRSKLPDLTSDKPDKPSPAAKKLVSPKKLQPEKLPCTSGRSSIRQKLLFTSRRSPAPEKPFPAPSSPSEIYGKPTPSRKSSIHDKPLPTTPIVQVVSTSPKSGRTLLGASDQPLLLSPSVSMLEQWRPLSPMRQITNPGSAKVTPVPPQPAMTPNPIEVPPIPSPSRTTSKRIIGKKPSYLQLKHRASQYTRLETSPNSNHAEKSIPQVLSISQIRQGPRDTRIDSSVFLIRHEEPTPPLPPVAQKRQASIDTQPEASLSPIRYEEPESPVSLVPPKPPTPSLARNELPVPLVAPNPVVSSIAASNTSTKRVVTPPLASPTNFSRPALSPQILSRPQVSTVSQSPSPLRDVLSRATLDLVSVDEDVYDVGSMAVRQALAAAMETADQARRTQLLSLLRELETASQASRVAEEAALCAERHAAMSRLAAISAKNGMDRRIEEMKEAFKAQVARM